MTTLRTASPRGELHDTPLEAVARLADRLAGRLYLRDERGYDQARAIWNGAIQTRPALIAYPADAGDAALLVRFARDHDIAVRVQGGGHNVAGSALVQDGLTINLKHMRAVEVDREAGVARIQGGATLAEVDAATQAHGLVVPNGFVSATGFAGLCLRGGLGHLMRRFGLTCDNLVGAEMVTSEGKIIRTKGGENPDLLWALRGGGENLGVVTTFELTLHELDPEVMFLMPIYPAEKGEEALSLLHRFIPEAPDELGVIGFYGRMSNSWKMPRSVPERDAFVFYGCYSGPKERADQATKPLRNLAGRLADLSAPMAYMQVQKFQDGDYPDGGRYYWRSLFLDDLNPQIISAVQEHAAARPSSKSTLDVWTLGGAVARVDPEDTAFRHRRARYMLAVEADWESPAEDRRNIAWARGVIEDMKRFSSRGPYMNFAGSEVENKAALAAAYGPNLQRLGRIKHRWDPANLFG
jgi:hypothetical protein